MEGCVEYESHLKFTITGITYRLQQRSEAALGFWVIFCGLLWYYLNIDNEKLYKYEKRYGKFNNT